MQLQRKCLSRPYLDATFSNFFDFQDKAILRQDGQE